MKLYVLSVLLCLLALALAAAQPSKQVLFTYPNGTPDSVMDSAKKIITDAGGMITHEFSLISGFVATTTEKVLNEVKALSTGYMPLVEDDTIIDVNGS